MRTRHLVAGGPSADHRLSVLFGVTTLIVVSLAVVPGLPASAAPPGFHPLNRTDTVHELGASTAEGPNTVVMGPDGRAWVTMGGSSMLMALDSIGRRTIFTTPTSHSSPMGLTNGPDGRLWFTEQSANRIGASTTAGVITEYPLTDPDAMPTSITTGPDGALWFTEQAANRIGRITTAGAVSSFPIPTPDAELSGITTGPDGALWFAESKANQIGRITTAGAVTEFPIPTLDASPVGIVTGPDGALWFTEFAKSQLGRITTAGTVTNEYPLVPNSGPDGISVTGQRLVIALQDADLVQEVDTAGAVRRTIEVSTGSDVSSAVVATDGTTWATETGIDRVAHVVPGTPPFEVLDLAVDDRPFIIIAGPQQLMWFTTGDKIGRINANGTVTYFAVPGANPNVTAMVDGPDGNVWFTQQDANEVGSMTPTGVFSSHPTGAGTGPWGITVGPDGNLWVALQFSDEIGRMTTTGGLTTYPVGVPNGEPSGIVTGHDGRVWFTLQSAGKIGATTTQGAVQTYDLPTVGANPGEIIAGPEGKQWYAEFQAEAIGWSSNAGVTDAQLVSTLIDTIAEGPDHDVWTSYYLASRAGWRSANGDVNDLHFVAGESSGLAKGHDGAMWFTNYLTGQYSQIVRLPLDSHVAMSGTVTPSAAAGATVSGSFTVDNTGRNDIGEPLLTLRPAPDETLQSVTSPAGWACAPPTGVPGGVATCAATQMPVFVGPQTFAFTATIASSAPSGTATVTATMSAVTPLTPASPAASVTTNVTGTTNPTTPPTSGVVPTNVTSTPSSVVPRFTA